MPAVRPRRSSVLAVVATVAVGAALAVVAAARAEDPETARWLAWHRERALRLRAMGLWTEAGEEWAAVAWLTPSDPHTAIQAAVEIAEAGSLPPRVFQPEDPSYKRADALCTEAARRGGTHDAALAYAIGRLKLAARDWPTAFTMLRIAQDRGFDRIRARYWYFVAAVNRAPGLLDEGRAEAAVRVLEDLVGEMPEHPQRLAADVNLATAWRRLGDPVRAEEVLRGAIARRPDAAKPWVVLGQNFADQRRNDDAADAYRRAMELSSELSEDPLFSGSEVLAEALFHAATTELLRGRLDDSQRLVDRFLGMQRDHPEGIALLGLIAQARGGAENLKEAVVHLRRASRLAPGDLAILTRLAEVLEAAGEETEAAEVRRKLDALRAAEEEARKERAGPPEEPKKE